MQKIYWLFVVLFFSISLSAQTTQEVELIKAVDTFFEGMQKADSNKLKSVTHPDLHLITTLTQMNKPYFTSMNRQKFLYAIMAPRKRPWREQLWTYQVFIEDNLATVTTEYTFYLGAEDNMISHCGINIFTMVKMPDGLWQIIQIADTRRYKNCINEGNTKKTEDRINTVMDSWHKAAAEADEEVFFDGLMTKDAIYLGTDASERWLRDELKEWSKVHFDKESAWSFTANWRNVYLSKNQRIAWFEESLDTWMGECRGSGILELINGEWKIKHYNLSIMVPNDIVKDFMDLVKNGPKTKEEEEPKTGKKKRKKKKSKKKK